MTGASTTWWAPLWRGLVDDPEAKHYRRLKNSVWLLLYLIVHADRQTGVLSRKYETIARDTGISPWTIRSWLRRLRAQGYVVLGTSGRASVIRIRRWRPVGRPHAAQKGMAVPVRRASPHKPGGGDVPNDEQRRGRITRLGGPNESPSTRTLLRESSGDRRKAVAREELLALELAEGLDDRPNLARYLRYARRFPEGLLRRLLGEVSSVPAARVKRSRAAIFASLLKRHAHGGRENSRS